MNHPLLQESVLLMTIDQTMVIIVVKVIKKR